jgi:hypothetical protein
MKRANPIETVGLETLLAVPARPRRVTVTGLESMGGGVVGEHVRVTPEGIYTQDAKLAVYLNNLGLHIQTIADAGGTMTLPDDSGPVAATTLTPAGLRAIPLACECLTPPEMLSSNTGYYHDIAHPVNVAGAVGELAASAGRLAHRIRFLQQVALLHDFDERIDLEHVEQGPVFGMPARVQVTLAWLDRNRRVLQQRLHWRDQEFVEAQCLIARTDYPFDTVARRYGTTYDGATPQSLYRDLLAKLPRTRRGPVMQDAVLLMFADQIGNYLGSQEQSLAAVLGLGQELGVPGQVLLHGAADYHRSVGHDIQVDRKLAEELRMEVELPTREQLEHWLSPESQRNLRSNRTYFRRVAKTRPAAGG